VGVITASTGAAIRDIITTINRRYRLAEIILFPCLVQGEGAKDDIVRNLTLADSLNLDTIILGRGGGSIEDLWAFNEEIVADAIYKAKTPIISAVGHEIDFTISDFVSDLRAPTPTAAAELAVPNTIDLINRIKQDEVLLSRSINKKIDFAKARLQAVLDSYILKNPSSMYEVKMQKLDTLIDKLISKTSILIENRNHKYSMLLEKLSTNIKNTIDVKGYSFTSLIDKLEALSPIKTFKRGYSITKCDNKIIKSIKNIKKDMILNTTLEDGYIVSKVMEVKDGK
jgi:exodeoxyribonuclease VII large subunit